LGMGSFESVRSRSTAIEVGGCLVRVASLEDVIRGKRTANRPKDRAVLPILEEVLRETKKEERSPARRRAPRVRRGR
jgi:hypothetical protein